MALAGEAHHFAGGRVLKKYLRILSVVALTAGLAGPLSTAASFAQTPPAQGASQTTGTIAGSIKDANGAPVAGATVTVTGPQTTTAVSDAQGNFAMANVTPGIYTLRATKTGYNTASDTNISVSAGAGQTLAITMSAITFSTLRTIASVRSTGRGVFNTSPASVSVISSQTFIDQGQPQVMKILNETPGVVASYPGTGGNGAAPGAITFPNVRGALSFETASLIDGHPISVGQYGDYVTTFLNPFMLQNVEIVKGPGADAPEVNYAIGGTVNFRTKEPSYKSSGMFAAGYDSHGSQILNFGISDTVGRFGYVFAFGSDDLQTGSNGAKVWVSPQTPQQGVVNYNGASGTAVGFNDAYPTPIVPGTVSGVENSYNLVACCQVVNNLFQNTSELMKMRYNLSSATSATFTYLGSQTTANQAANTGDISHATFHMSPSQAAGYTGPLANNSPLDIGYVRSPEEEYNNEPIFEGDIRTTLQNDTVLARFYSAGIHRLIFQGSGIPNIPTVQDLQLYGYDSGTHRNYNGQMVPVAFFDNYAQTEIDSLKGYSFQYNHPFDNGADLATFSYDTTNSSTVSYSQRTNGPRTGRAFNVASVSSYQAVNLPQGSTQDFSTALLRGVFRVNTKTTLTLSNYLNTYKSTYPVACVSNCNFNAGGWLFATSNTSHYDPRLAVEFRPSGSLALRFAAGSAIAPPYLGILGATTQPIAYSAPAPFATQQVSPTNLRPETAFGYDLGGDYRFHDGVTTVSGDIYSENLFNHFLNRSINSGTTCPAIDPLTGAPTDCPANTPLFYNTYTNISNARFQGIELSLRRSPPSGIGYTVQGALQKAYAYDLPPYFYCSIPGAGCTQDSNLGIVPGMNFTSGGIDGGNLSTNGLSNQSIPYAQGYGELNWRSGSGMYANVNLTYFGKNNSLNVPAFTTLGATLRVPLESGLSFQISGDNLTNKYSTFWPQYGSGLPIALANGQSAATQANVLGPSTIRFFITKSFGAGTNP
ncbi:MAG: TonB-dependent receptor domain-containing protein [Candidatus Baltobacteraceae bacterium]